MLKSALFAVAALLALPLAACNDGPSTTAPASQAQQVLSQARTTYLFVSLAASTYNALPPCGDTAKLCKNEAVAAQIATGVAAAGTALELAQKALDAGDTPSTYQKVKLALDAAMAALKIAQSYGLG